MTDYQYDVFLSYRRKRRPKMWVDEVFYPLFEDLLCEALGGREPRIFKDVEEIRGGDNWHARVCNALATSKCLVPVLLPSYFTSEWCVREFSIIHNRQLQLGYNSLDNPHGLIVPIKIHDGESFPEGIDKINICDFNDYFYTGKGLELTTKYIELESKLIKWVEKVAFAIRNAPEWDPKFLDKEKLNYFNHDLFNDDSHDMIQAPSL